MTDKLPTQLLALFQPRPALRYIPPQDESPETRGTKSSEIGGLAAFIPQLEVYKQEDVYHPTESWLQRKARIKAEKTEKQRDMESEDFEGYDPNADPKIKGDALKTLFVGRLSYEARESDLEREFGRFGPIERIRLVKHEGDLKSEGETKSKKAHRGYAFIVYERERDMKAAYKETDGLRIKDRRVVVDVERGRMVKGWKPMRFGGGLGGRGYTKTAPAKPSFGAPPGPGGFQGGFRGRGGFGDRGGGFRGGFRGDRGGFGGRGGIGYQDRGGFGNRGGYQNGAPPPNAPSGPGSRGGGFGGGSANGYEDRGRNGYGDSRGGGGGGGGGRYDSRDPRGGGGSTRDQGSDRGGYGDRDRDRERDRFGDSRGGNRRDEDYGSRKRHHDGDGYDDPRSKRRY